MYRKVKFSIELKKECMSLIFLKHRSVMSVSKEKGVSVRLLGRWKNLYEQKGITGLIPKKTKIYSPDFKLKVLNIISRDTISLEQACIDFDIGSSATIVNWQRCYKSNGFIGLQNKPKGRVSTMKSKSLKKKLAPSLTREEELLQENKSLKAELDYLKKLQALVQARVSKEKRL